MVDTERRQLGEYPIGGLTDHVGLHQVTRWIDGGTAQDRHVNRAGVVSQRAEHRVGHLPRAGDRRCNTC